MPVYNCVAECAWNGGYMALGGASFFEDVPLVEFMSLGFTRMPGELLLVTQVFVVVLVLHILSAD